MRSPRKRQADQPLLTRPNLSSYLPSILIFSFRASTLAGKFALSIFVGVFIGLAELGLFGLAVGATAVAPAFAGFGIVHLIMREAVSSNKARVADDLRHYVSFTLAIYAPPLVVALAAAIFFEVEFLWSLIIAIALFEHLGQAIFHLLSNLERHLLANANAFLRSAAWIFVYVPLAWAEPAFRSLSMLLAFWALAGFLGVVHFTCEVRRWPWKQAFAAPFRRAWIINNIRSAFNVYIADAAFVASLYLDRYIVTAFLGLRLAGVYFLYWSFANAVSTFVSTAVLQTQRPRLIRAFDEIGKNAHLLLVSKVMKTTAMASLLYSILVAVCFCAMLPFLEEPAAIGDYVGSFFLILGGMALRNIADFGSMALFTSRRDSVVMLTGIVSVIFLSLFQILFLPIGGLAGAGLAIAITFLGMIFWRHYLLFGTISAWKPAASPGYPGF